MGLMQKFLKKREQLNEEKSVELTEKRKDLFEDELVALDNSVYANLNISRLDLMNYVQSEVLKISPIFAPILLKPIKQSTRNFIISSNGLGLTVGEKFFTEPLEIVICETLKVVTSISLGHYMLVRTKSSVPDYITLLSFAMREVYTRVLNSLLRVSPLSVGIIASNMKFTADTIEKCLNPCTDKISSGWRDIPCIPIQNAVEEKVYDFFLYGDQTQSKTFTISVPHSQDTITFTIPANFVENYKKLKNVKDKIKDLDKEKDNLDAEKQRQQRRKQLREDKKRREEEEKQKSQDSQDQSTQQSQDSQDQSTQQSQDSQDQSTQQSQDSTQSSQSPNQQDSQDQSQDSSQPSTDQQSQPQTEQQTQSPANQQRQPSTQSPTDSQQSQPSTQSPTDQQNSESSSNFGNEEVQGFDQTQPQQEQQNMFGDSLKDYSQQDLLDALNDLLSNMEDGESVENDLNQSINDKGLQDMKSIMNELKDMAKQNPELQEKIQDAIDKMRDSKPQEAQDLQDKFSNYDSDNLSDLTQEQMQDLVSQLAGQMTEQELNDWNKNIQDQKYQSYEEAIQDLLENEDYTGELSEATKQALEDTINDMLNEMQEPYKDNSSSQDFDLSDEDLDWDTSDNFDYDSQDSSSAQSQQSSQDSSSQQSSQSMQDSSSQSQQSSQDSPSQQSSQSMQDSPSAQSQQSPQYSSSQQSSQPSQDSSNQQSSQPLQDSSSQGQQPSQDLDSSEQMQSPTANSETSDLTREALEQIREEFKEQQANLPESDETEFTEEQLKEWNDEYKERRKELEEQLQQELDGIDPEMSEHLDTLENMDADMTEENLKELIQSMNQISESHGGLGSPSLANRTIVDIFKVKVTWYSKVEQMIKKFLPTYQPTYRIPNKKLLYRDIILPSNRGKDMRNAVDYLKLYLDSSGSMTEKDISILCSILKRLSKKFPKQTEAYEFNDAIFPLKVRNGKLLERPSHSGGTQLKCVLAHLSKRESGRVLTFIITDGGFFEGWDPLRDFMKSRPREKLVVILTQGSRWYKKEIETNLGLPKSRFQIIAIENEDIPDLSVHGF